MSSQKVRIGMVSGCYAFKSTFSSESLEEHLTGVAECILGRWELEALARKEAVVIYGELREEYLREVKGAIALAGLVHDLGKALASYQATCEKAGCTEFSGHDIYSAWIAYTAFKKRGVLKGSFENTLKKLYREGAGDAVEPSETLAVVNVVVPVFFHHYAQRSSDKLRAQVSQINPSQRVAELQAGCVEQLREAAGRLRRRVEGMLVNAVDEFLEQDLVEHEIRLAIVDFEKLLDIVQELKVTVFKSFSEATLGILNLCDGIVAREKRKA
ncbi:hypothetical protein [Thermofilum pendens]